MVRAKFVVQSLTQRGYQPGIVHQVDVEMSAVYCGRQHATEAEKADCESHSYSAATPSGLLKLTINNPAAYSQFAVGQAFYLDFRPAEEGN